MAVIDITQMARIEAIKHKDRVIKDGGIVNSLDDITNFLIQFYENFGTLSCMTYSPNYKIFGYKNLGNGMYKCYSLFKQYDIEVKLTDLEFVDNKRGDIIKFDLFSIYKLWNNNELSNQIGLTQEQFQEFFNFKTITDLRTYLNSYRPIIISEWHPGYLIVNDFDITDLTTFTLIDLTSNLKVRMELLNDENEIKVTILNWTFATTEDLINNYYTKSEVDEKIEAGGGSGGNGNNVKLDQYKLDVKQTNSLNKIEKINDFYYIIKNFKLYKISETEFENWFTINEFNSNQNIINSVGSIEEFYLNENILICLYSNKITLYDIIQDKILITKTSSLGNIYNIIKYNNKFYIFCESKIIQFEIENNQIINFKEKSLSSNFNCFNILNNKIYYSISSNNNIYVINDDITNITNFSVGFESLNIFNYENKLYLVGTKNIKSIDINNNIISLVDNNTNTYRHSIKVDDNLYIVSNKSIVKFSLKNEILEKSFSINYGGDGQIFNFNNFIYIISYSQDNFYYLINQLDILNDKIFENIILKDFKPSISNEYLYKQINNFKYFNYKNNLILLPNLTLINSNIIINKEINTLLPNISIGYIREIQNQFTNLNNKINSLGGGTYQQVGSQYECDYYNFEYFILNNTEINLSQIPTSNDLKKYTFMMQGSPNINYETYNDGVNPTYQGITVISCNYENYLIK